MSDFDLQPRIMTPAELDAFDWGLGAGILPESFLVHLVDTDMDELRLGDGTTPRGVPYSPGCQAGRYRSDTLLGAPYSGTAINNSTTIAANTLYAVFCPVPRRGSFASLVSHVDVAAGGASGRVGVYRDSNGQPGELIHDFGTISLGTTGQKVANAGGPIILGAGPHWLALVANGTPTIHGYPTQAYGGLGYDSSSYARTNGLQRSFTFSVMPADESAQTYSLVSGSTPALFLGF